MTTDERIAYEGTCVVARDRKDYDQLEAALAFLSDATVCLERLRDGRVVEVEE